MQALALYAQTAVEPNDNIPVPTAYDVKTALDWILEKACLTFEHTYYDNDRDSTHAQGRRSAGLCIITAMKLKPEIFDENRTKSGTDS